MPAEKTDLYNPTLPAILYSGPGKRFRGRAGEIAAEHLEVDDGVQTLTIVALAESFRSRSSTLKNPALAPRAERRLGAAGKRRAQHRRDGHVQRGSPALDMY